MASRIRKAIGFLTLLFAMCVITGVFANGDLSLKLSETNIRVSIGKTVNIKPTIVGENTPAKVSYTWESSDENVFTVSNGNVKAINGGSATLTCTASSEDGAQLQASSNITVIVPVNSITLNSDKSITLLPGESEKISYTILPENASNQSLVWTSKDETVAVADKFGSITAKGQGKTTITATSSDGSNKTISVNVYVPVLESKSANLVFYNQHSQTVSIKCFDNDFDNNVTIKIDNKKGEVGSSYNFDRETHNLTFTIYPLYPGECTITIMDKQDTACKSQIGIQITKDAIIDPYGAYVCGLKTNQGASYLSYEVELKNATDKTITDVYFIVTHYDQFGNQHICINSEDGFPHYYTYRRTMNIAPGKTYKHSNYNNNFLTERDPIAEMRAAVYEYRYSDGTLIKIPDEQLVWFSSKTGFAPRMDIERTYVGPSESEIEKADEYLLGYTTRDLYSCISKTYAGSKYGGVYILKINEDSIAQKCGLLAGDVIYGVDGVMWSSDPMIITRAKAKIYDGETVIFNVIRNGIKKKIEMTWTEGERIIDE